MPTYCGCIVGVIAGDTSVVAPEEIIPLVDAGCLTQGAWHPIVAPHWPLRDANNAAYSIRYEVPSQYVANRMRQVISDIMPAGRFEIVVVP